MPKIEVVRQRDLKDCGACCLQAIIKYYKGYVPIEKIREDTYTNINGTSAYHLIKAAQNYGFEAMGIKTDSLLNENLYFPAIAHVILKNGLQHFVVIYKVSNEYVYLMDPAIGKEKKKLKEFTEIFDNILILFTPISEILKMNKEVTIYNLFCRLLLKNKKLFVMIFMMNIFFIVMAIISNFYFQITLSGLNNYLDLKFLKFLVLAFGIIILLKVISNYLKSYYLNYFNKNLDAEIFVSFLKHIFNLPLKFIQNRTTGEIITRVEELSEVKTLISEIFANVLLNSVLIGGTIVVLYFISSKLFFVLCLVVSLYIIVGIIFSKIIYTGIKKNIEISTKFKSTLVEQVEMNNSIKNLNLNTKFEQHLEDKLIKMLKNNFKLTNMLNNILLIRNLIYELGLFLITTYGIYLIYNNNLEILSLVTFNSLILYLFDPVRETIDLIPKYQFVKASFKKLEEFINLETEECVGIQLSIEQISANDLCFSYNNYNNILDGLNFTINKQDKVLIDGPSGCGKSTICKLLYRTLSDYKGQINFGNLSEKNYNLNKIRTDILYVGQEENLFTGTIKDNITCFRKVSDEELLKILNICKVDEIIEKRPSKLETVINAASNNLSGGEKQRIILARGLLKKANIIILDEALSEVNLALEESIIDNILNNFKDKTIIYVSHKNVQAKFAKIIKLEANNE